VPIRPSQSVDGGARKLGRWVDMRVQVRIADVEALALGASEWRIVADPDREQLDNGRKRWRTDGEETIGTFGGVWDRKRKRWAKRHPLDPDAKLVYRIHRGQDEAGRWLTEWLRRWAAGDWRGVRRAWSALMVGGRRSGKTHLAVLGLFLFATMKARALTWVVSPTIDTGHEIDVALLELIPSAWRAERVSSSSGKSTEYLLPNGSTVMLKSGVNPDRLKAGRVDFAIYNEAQLQSSSGYVKLRGAIADRGGLVVEVAGVPFAVGALAPEERLLKSHDLRELRLSFVAVAEAQEVLPVGEVLPAGELHADVRSSRIAKALDQHPLKRPGHHFIVISIDRYHVGENVLG
jgi:hypothetical protein